MTERIGNTILWIVASVVICTLGAVCFLQQDRLSELAGEVKKLKAEVTIYRHELVLVRNAVATFEQGYLFVGK